MLCAQCTRDRLARVFPGDYGDWRENGKIENVVRARLLSLRRFFANSNSSLDEPKVLRTSVIIRQKGSFPQLSPRRLSPRSAALRTPSIAERDRSCR